MTFADIPPHLRRELVIAHDPEPAEIARTFTEAELEEAAALSSKKGREERLVSRYAAKRLLAQWTGSPPREIEIFADERRPRCRVAGTIQLPHLSLSHSGGWGAALASGTSAGVDIEVARSIDPRAFKFFLSDDELPLLEQLGANAAVKLWSAKEAAWKISNPLTVRKIVIVEVEQWIGRSRLRYRAPEDEGSIELFETGPLVVAVARSMKTPKA